MGEAPCKGSVRSPDPLSRMGGGARGGGAGEQVPRRFFKVESSVRHTLEVLGVFV